NIGLRPVRREITSAEAQKDIETYKRAISAQPPAHVGPGCALHPHPPKDVAHHPGFLEHDRKARGSAPLLLADRAVAIGGMAEDAAVAGLGRMALATPTALERSAIRTMNGPSCMSAWSGRRAPTMSAPIPMWPRNA